MSAEIGRFLCFIKYLRNFVNGEVLAARLFRVEIIIVIDVLLFGQLAIILV